MGRLINNHMLVIVNDQLKEIDFGCTIDRLLTSYGKNEHDGVAVARNSEVVPRELWTDTFINENDRIMIIQAAQGG